MRQAGRYLPEYKEIRSYKKNFVELCLDVELATKITLQPIERYDFDAAIIFSDILLIPMALGSDLQFKKNEGPVLTGSNFSFNEKKFCLSLNNVYRAISRTKKLLDNQKALIGFSGAPLTLMSYMIGTKREDCIDFIKSNNRKAHYLLDTLEESIAVHLCKQIEAGADMVKIFDSWSGLLKGEKELYKSFVINPTRRIIERVKEYKSTTPVMAFPRGSGLMYKDYLEKVRPDILTIDYDINLWWAKKNLIGNVILQGNLNPQCLLKGKSEIAKEVHKIVNVLGKNNLIFNLGHGVLQHTPVENVKYLVEVVRSV